MKLKLKLNWFFFGLLETYYLNIFIVFHNINLCTLNIFILHDNWFLKILKLKRSLIRRQYIFINRKTAFHVNGGHSDIFKIDFLIDNSYDHLLALIITEYYVSYLMEPSIPLFFSRPYFNLSFLTSNPLQRSLKNKSL